MMFQRKATVRHVAFGKDNLDRKSVEQDGFLIQHTHFTDEGTEAPAKTLGCLKLTALFQ